MVSLFIHNAFIVDILNKYVQVFIIIVIFPLFITFDLRGFFLQFVFTPISVFAS